MGLEVDTSGDEPVVIDHRKYTGQFLNTSGLREYLDDQVRVESALVEWLKAHPRSRLSGHRRLVLKTRRWLQAHRPVLHVGPCDHRDCY